MYVQNAIDIFLLLTLPPGLQALGSSDYEPVPEYYFY